MDNNKEGELEKALRIIGNLPKSEPLASQSQAAQPTITAPLKLYAFTEDGMEIDNAFGHWYKKDDVERLLAAYLAGQSQATMQAEPIAWAAKNAAGWDFTSESRAMTNDHINDALSTEEGRAIGPWELVPLYAATVAKEAPAVPEGPQQKMKDVFAHLLSIQKAEAETGDTYMLGLYNGMSMMCANIDGDLSWEPMAAPQAPATQEDEILALHRDLAAEKLRADQGWQRAEAKSKECIELRERMAATQEAEIGSVQADEVLHQAIFNVLSNHRMVRMFEVENDGALGNSYPLIDRLCLDDGHDTESGKDEIEAIADAILDALDDELLASRFRAQGGITNTESSDLAPTTSTVSAPALPLNAEGIPLAFFDWWEEWSKSRTLKHEAPDRIALDGWLACLAALAATSSTEGTQEAPEEVRNQWAKWIVQRGLDLPDHACAECVPHGEIIKPGFQCVYHQALALLTPGGAA